MKCKADDNDVLFLWDSWPTNIQQLYIQKGSSTESLTIVTFQHVKAWTNPRLLKQQYVVLPLHHICWYNNTSTLYETITRKSANQGKHEKDLSPHDIRLTLVGTKPIFPSLMKNNKLQK